MAEETNAQPAFDHPTFRALFVESLEPERITFYVDEGRECWIDLLPMGDSDLDRYNTLGIDYEASTSGDVKLKGVDMETRKRFLISHTVLAWEVWERHPLKGGNGKLSDWQKSILPAEPRQRTATLESKKFVGEFGQWLVRECERVNGLLEGQAKN